MVVQWVGWWAKSTAEWLEPEWVFQMETLKVP
jgi:hypothetical protein